MPKENPNREIAQLLGEIGEYLEMQRVPFKPRAYIKAAEEIASLAEGLDRIYEKEGLKGLRNVPAVGMGIAQKIEEFLKTGRIREHVELKKRTPVNLAALTAVEGLGPQNVKRLYEELGIRDLAGLEKAARAGRIRKLAGFGPRSEERILAGIEFLKRSGGRRLLSFALGEARGIEEHLRSMPEVSRLAVAGSLRRRRETIGDIDILVVSRHPRAVMENFVSMSKVVRVQAHGRTKSSVKLASGLDVDLRVVPEASYGAALNYFTGSKDHNVSLRELAMSKGMKLNEYGLFRGRRQMAGRTEEDLYRALGLAYVEPEMRENAGEIELAKKDKLPSLVGYKDIEGDLQIQTDWTDGQASIEAMAKAAMAKGLKYIAITDHTQRLKMTRGLDEKRLLKQMAEIDRVNRRLGGKIRILKGSECDILKDGSLDLPDKALGKLEVVGVSVHSYFNLSREEQTERLLIAMRNPNADIVFHPTGRVIERRPAYELDMAKLIRGARETGTVLEVDAYPDRLDLKDEHIRECVRAGVKLAVDSDAHHPAHLDYLEYGVSQARRGWAERKDVINAWPVEKMLSFLKNGRARR